MTAPIRSMPELIAALKARAQAIGIAYGTIDAVAGLPDRYTSKLFAPVPIKNLGPMSFEAILGALGLTVTLVEDVAQVAKVESRWVKTKRRPSNQPLASTFSIPNEVPVQIEITPELQGKLRTIENMKAWGQMGGRIGGKKRMKTMGKRARQRVAAHAARMRWARTKSPASAVYD